MDCIDIRVFLDILQIVSTISMFTVVMGLKNKDCMCKKDYDDDVQYDSDTSSYSVCSDEDSSECSDDSEDSDDSSGSNSSDKTAEMSISGEIDDIIEMVIAEAVDVDVGE